MNNWLRALLCAVVAAVWAGNFALATDAPGWAVYGLGLIIWNTAFWGRGE